LERYEKTIQNQNGSIPGFTEEITYSGDLKFSIRGITTGTDAGDCNISMPLVLSCSPQVSDMHMSLSGVNVDVPQTVISNEVDITGINEEVTKIPGVHVNGHTDRSNAPHIVSVSTEGVRAEVLLHALEDKEIYVSAGSACSSNKPSVSHTLKSIGLKPELLDATIRFSFCVETTEEEIDYAVKEMAALVPMLQKYTRH